MRGEVWITAAKGCKKIIFKCLDGAFCRIGAVQVGRGDLKSDTFLAHEEFEGCWERVVQHLEGWAETALGHIGLHSRVFADKFVLAPQFHRLGNNSVSIMVIKDHDILAATTGGHQEKASLIS